MVRRSLIVLAVAATFVACGSFGASDPASSTTSDGGIEGSASTDATSGGPTRRDGAVTSDPSACPSSIKDDFGRAGKPIVTAPWRGLLEPAPNQVKILDDALVIETQADAGGLPYVLTTGPFAAPSSVKCTFRFKKRTVFNSSNLGSPIDLLVYIATRADGSRTLVRFSYSEGQFSIRNDEHDADDACTSCPSGATATRDFGLQKDTWVDLSVAVNASGASFGSGGTLVTRAHSLGPLATAEIYFGVWSYSDYEQNGVFEDLACVLACP